MDSSAMSAPDDLQQHRPTPDSKSVAPNPEPVEKSDVQSSRLAQGFDTEASAYEQPVDCGNSSYGAEIQQLMEAKKKELLQKLNSQKEDIAPHDNQSEAIRTRQDTSCQQHLEDNASGFQPKLEGTDLAPLATENATADCDGDSSSKRAQEVGLVESERVSKRLRTSTEKDTAHQDLPTIERKSGDHSFGCWKNIALASAAESEFVGAWTDFETNPDNFLKGCKWSPDGSCLLTNSNDNCLRVFQLPPEVWPSKGLYHMKLAELKSTLQIQEAELIYDYAWYTQMSLADPDTCCLVSSGRNAPIHMWDSQTGELRCSYRAFDHMDELTAAYSLAFSIDGTKLYSGFSKMIRVFDVSRPGRDCEQRPTFVKQGQTGIISCIAMNPANHAMYAAGSYTKSVALYMEPNGEMYCMFEGQNGGVTQVMFSNDGNRLYSGGRKDSEILCWDLRNPGKILAIMHRKVGTNQRIYFDLTDQFLWSAGTDGMISAWDITNLDKGTSEEEQQEAEEVLPLRFSFAASCDAVNGIGCHPQLPILAAATGQRYFPLPSGLEDSSDSEAEQTSGRENSLKLYWKTT